jgi:hypothetical protein
MVERGRSSDSQPLHHGEAGSVDDREALIRKSLADRPGGLQIREADRFDRDARPRIAPVTLRGILAEPRSKQEPRFDKDMIGRQKRLP